MVISRKIIILAALILTVVCVGNSYLFSTEVEEEQLLIPNSLESWKEQLRGIEKDFNIARLCSAPQQNIHYRFALQSVDERIESALFILPCWLLDREKQERIDKDLMEWLDGLEQKLKEGSVYSFLVIKGYRESELQETIVEELTYLSKRPEINIRKGKGIEKYFYFVTVKDDNHFRLEVYLNGNPVSGEFNLENGAYRAEWKASGKLSYGSVNKITVKAVDKTGLDSAMEATFFIDDDIEKDRKRIEKALEKNDITFADGHLAYLRESGPSGCEEVLNSLETTITNYMEVPTVKASETVIAESLESGAFRLYSLALEEIEVERYDEAVDLLNRAVEVDSESRAFYSSEITEPYRPYYYLAKLNGLMALLAENPETRLELVDKSKQYLSQVSEDIKRSDMFLNTVAIVEMAGLEYENRDVYDDEILDLSEPIKQAGMRGNFDITISDVILNGADLNIKNGVLNFSELLLENKCKEGYNDFTWKVSLLYEGKPFAERKFRSSFFLVKRALTVKPELMENVDIVESAKEDIATIEEESYDPYLEIWKGVRSVVKIEKKKIVPEKKDVEYLKKNTINIGAKWSIRVFNNLARIGIVYSVNGKRIAKGFISSERIYTSGDITDKVNGDPSFKGGLVFTAKSRMTLETDINDDGTPGEDRIVFFFE